MDMQDLKVFEAVARHGGMKRAAEELATVQSNVTARIRALEEDLERRVRSSLRLRVRSRAGGQRRGRRSRRRALAQAEACDIWKWQIWNSKKLIASYKQ